MGILGAGYIADFHALALRAIEGVELVAICDRDPNRGRRLAESHGVPRVYSDLSAMLDAEELDVAHVLVPADAHFACAQAILGRGVDVVLEKPLCIDSGQCEDLLRGAETAGRVVGVSHNFLFSTPYQKLRDDLAAKKLGRLSELVIVWNKELPQLHGDARMAWWLEQPGGVMLEIGPHSFAHLLDLVGEPDQLTAESGDEIPRPGGGSFRRRWRVRGNQGETAFELRFCFAPGYSEHYIHARGSLASATADFERNVYLRHRHFPSDPDLDRLRATLTEARSAGRQAASTLARYALSKLGVPSRGNPYQESIQASVRAFYAGRGAPLDPRISPELGRRVVRFGEEVVRLAGDAACRAPRPRVVVAKLPEPPRVLVLGGTGFIGRELVRQLAAEGHAVRVLSRKADLPAALSQLPLELAQGDLTDRDSVEDALDGIEVVYHLARAYGRTWQDYLREEVLPTGQLAETCLRRGIRRLVYTSSIAIHYAGKRAGTITDETPPRPGVLRGNVYARAKAEVEAILMRLHRERSLPVVVTRPGIVIGRGASPLHPGVAQWHYGSVCQFYGAGDTPLPIVLVEDVAAALVRCLDREGIDGVTLNLVGDPLISAQEYVAVLEDALDVRFDRQETPAWRFFAGDVLKWMVKILARHSERALPSYRACEGRSARAVYDCSRAKQLLGWRPSDDRARILLEGVQLPAAEFLL